MQVTEEELNNMVVDFAEQLAAAGVSQFSVGRNGNMLSVGALLTTTVRGITKQAHKQLQIEMPAPVQQS